MRTARMIAPAIDPCQEGSSLEQCERFANPRKRFPSAPELGTPTNTRQGSRRLRHPTDRKGEILAVMGRRVLPFEKMMQLPSLLCRLSFHVEYNFYLCPFSLRRIAICFFMNHSCDPNTCGDEELTLTTIAARRIEAGEEITCDYKNDFLDKKNRIKPFRTFKCVCGAKKCRRIVRH